MPKATEAITNFLTAKRDKGEHQGPDMLDRFLQYGCNMEVQVNVAPGKGEKVDGKRSTYADEVGNTWFNFRIPKGADKEPVFNDFELRFPLDLHCDGVGSTGWDWKAKRSRWVGFDFDSIVGHAEGVGVDEGELERVREAAKALPYVEVRKSTGGGGLHIYVCFEDVEAFDTKNHSEHAALARAILDVMSLDAGHDFKSAVDACGGNMWLWHKKSIGTEGFKLLKAGELFPASKLPATWRNHLPVVRYCAARVKMDGVAPSEQDLFDQLAAAHPTIDLDSKHRAMIDFIRSEGIVCDFQKDYHCIQTHTIGFKRLMDRAEEFGITGVFQTISPGRDLATFNCFAFPLPNGGWKIYRFGFSGRIPEAPTWEHDNQGKTLCWFNVRPNLDRAAKSLGGRKMDKGGYEFDTLEKALQVARLLKPEFEYTVEEHLKNRPAIVRKSKDGQLAIEIEKKGGDEDLPKGDWNSSDKKSAWTQVFNVAAQPEKLEVSNYDNIIRRLQTTERKNAGWVAKVKEGEWTQMPAGEIKMILQELGHAKPDAEQIMGRYALQPWKLVSLPFQEEYLPNRRWNLDAPQYRFQPAPRTDAAFNDVGGEDSRHPHWDKILNHVGEDLNKYLKEQDWAITYGIRSGADYLQAIFASILRYPTEPTPYIFLFGPENSGKSILHEAFELLVTSGVVKADRALTSQSDFNGELAGAVLCVVEEKDLSKTPGAYAKIKDAVTSLKLSIRKMRTDSYMVDNTTHWIQNANDHNACYVSDGDTRITMIYVPSLKQGTEIPKTLLMQKLTEEAPYFMRTLMDMQLPPPVGRLRVPVVTTMYKQRQEQLSRSALESFIAENLHEVPGALLPYGDFYAKFQEWLPMDERGQWSKQKVSRSLPSKFPSGTGNENKTYIINAAWEPKEADPNAKPWYVSSGRIKRS